MACEPAVYGQSTAPNSPAWSFGLWRGLCFLGGSLGSAFSPTAPASVGPLSNVSSVASNRSPVSRLGVPFWADVLAPRLVGAMRSRHFLPNISFPVVKHQLRQTSLATTDVVGRETARQTNVPILPKEGLSGLRRPVARAMHWAETSPPGSMTRTTRACAEREYTPNLANRALSAQSYSSSTCRTTSPPINKNLRAAMSMVCHPFTLFRRATPPLPFQLYSVLKAPDMKARAGEPCHPANCRFAV